MPEEQKKIIFPENTSIIISDLLKKYGLEEDEETLLGKYESGEPTNGEIISGLLRSIADKGDMHDVSIQEMELVLAEKLGTTIEKAKGLAKDIKEQILDLATTGEIAPEEKTAEENKENIIPPGKDIYREPID